jgi:DNA-binding transcriptional ArsR family regulator
MSLLPSRGPETSTSQDGELQVVGVDEDVAAVLDALSSETARNILNAVYEEPGTPSELADRLEMSIQNVSYHLEKLHDEELIAVAGTQYSEKGQEMTVYEPPDDPLVVFVGTPDRKRTLRSMLERFVPAIGLLTAASVMIQVVFGKLPGLFGTPETGGEPSSQVDAGGANETGSVEPTESAPGTEATPSPESASGAESTSAPETTATDSGEIRIQDTNPRQTEAPAETQTATPADSQTEDASTVVEFTQEATETATTAASGGFDLEPGVAFFLGGVLVLAVVGVTWAYTE